MIRKRDQFLCPIGCCFNPMSSMYLTTFFEPHSQEKMELTYGLLYLMSYSRKLSQVFVPISYSYAN